MGGKIRNGREKAPKTVKKGKKRVNHGGEKYTFQGGRNDGFAFNTPL